MKNTDLKCDKGFIPQENISNNFKNLSHSAGVGKSSEQVNKTLSKTDINAATEMFMYLNSCPSFYVKLYWKAIYGPRSRMAMLASNIIKKANNDFKIKATQIFAKMSHVFGFEHISFKKANEFEIKTLDINVTNEKVLRTMNNHPVHILNNEGGFSPSSFIPFCSFGEDFLGSKVDQFGIPVCNIFKPKVHHNQLCYETDLHDLKSSEDQILEEQLALGLTLVLDYNEDRQINYNNVTFKDAKKSLYHHQANSVSIHLNTISIDRILILKI